MPGIFLNKLRAAEKFVCPQQFFSTFCEAKMRDEKMVFTTSFHFFFIMAENKNPDKIILFAKRPGQTSFASLFTIKHALNTQKVGHTGTLDSFACGLLVVCTGALTRLCGRISEFDKTYEAVIEFGKETDTLECTGAVIRTAGLPSLEKLNEALSHFSGTYMQVPPSFSAIHVNGRRASDIVRSGKTAEIPARPVTVFESALKETDIEVSEDGSQNVRAARISFTVSKGTYIRSLARDIANYCGSAATLVGLLRTKIGNFELKDSAGCSLLDDFSIESARKNALLTVQKEQERRIEAQNKEKTFARNRGKSYEPSEEELCLQKEVLEKALSMTEDIAVQCGFAVLYIKDEFLPQFKNGGKLRSDWFTVSPFSIENEFAVVFSSGSQMCGLLQKNSSGYFQYSFVIN